MKYFKPTSWAIDHKVPVYVMTIFISIIGLISYISLPKEQFPDIVIPTIVVQTIHPGNSPADIENLITRPIEKQLKAISGVKKITSQSVPDASVIIVEFNTGIDPIVAKQRVNDGVDKAKVDLPQDLLKEPMVQDVDFSEFPIMYINIYGDLEPYRLKVYADDLKDKIETMKEITRVDIVGAPEREFQVDMDLIKMQSAGINFDDVERAIAMENVNISAGDIVIGGVRRNLRLISQFKNVDDIRNIMIATDGGGHVYLKDIADINDDFKEQQNFARLNGKPVISMNVIKKSGQNLIEASDKIRALIQDYEKHDLPKGVKITITGDMSNATRTNLADLINSVVIGFVLVVLVLMFFLGVRDSIFVASSVPIASFLAFLVMPGLGFTFNVVVTFAFLLALGIIVDDAIVVIENTHRLHTKEGLPIKKAAKMGATEVFVPVLTGTMTTLAPFFPLLFFPGIVGKFMFFLPAILIITLTASLVVAYIINPVLAVDFMDVKRDPREGNRKLHLFGIITALVGILAHLAGVPFLGNLAFFVVIIGYLNRFLVTPVLIKGFQDKIQPAMMNLYRRTLAFAIRKNNSAWFIAVTFIALIVVYVLFFKYPVQTNFFPSGDPNFIYAYIEMPIGTDATVTDSVTKVVENKIYDIIGRNNPAVNSVISNVGIGAGDPRSSDKTVTPYKGKVTVAFVEFVHRHGISSAKYLDEIRAKIKDYPGVKIKIDKEANGPPTGKPINIEIAGDKFEVLTNLQDQIMNKIVASNIQGIEKLSSDLQQNKPEILLEVNKAKANDLGISSAAIGMTLRTAVFGKEATKLKDDKDEYSVQIRLKQDERSDLNTLLNMPLTFKDNKGQLKQIPVSSIAQVSYITSYAGINRKNQKRTVTVSSNVLSGFSTPEVNAKIKKVLNTIKLPDGYTISQTGEQEDQMETMAFLGKAMIISLFLILIILVTQFNSLGKTFIILSQVLLSTMGVFLGFLIFRFPMSIVMTGIGVVALAGIVVRNGIVLLDFIEEYHKETRGSIRKAIVLGGSTRFNPVVLTASATILGVVPLAFGFNINFVSLFANFNPQLFIGGDSAALWGPLAWVIIFGLSFATFLTLIVVPCIYFAHYAYFVKARRRKELRQYRKKLRLDAKFGKLEIKH